MAQENGKRDNKKKGKGGKTVAGAALLLALLGGGGYFGLGIGNDNGGLIPAGEPATTAVQAESSAEQVQTTAETTPQETQIQTLTIQIDESKIVYNGKTVTPEELEEALSKDYKDGMTVKLIDHHAIKSVYENAEAVLNKLHLTFEKTTAAD